MEIRFKEDSVGLEDVHGKPSTFHVIAELYDGETLIARRMVQGCTDMDNLDERAQKAFAEFEPGCDPEPAPIVKSDTDRLAALKASLPSTIEHKAAEAKVLPK